MAGLCTGISYGLSQSSLNNNKELIFVKLTDSAYRAIEEYQKNQAKLNPNHATIQFIGNEGILSFPSVANSLGQKFSFTIADNDGPQGSFECIQQSQDQLEVLGALETKMRIHANDDAYKRTKIRMAEAEKTLKEKSTREIKPNQTDIGRTVKLKHSSDRLPNIPNNLLNKRDSSQNNSISSINNNVILNNNNNSNNNININNSTTTTISTSASSGTGTAISNTKSSISSNGTPPAVNNNVLPMINGCQSNGIPMSGNKIGTNRSSNSSSSSSQNGRTVNEISKRNIKERLIHLLAIRPYKKPEVFAKVVAEGIRDREKNCIYNVLKTVAYMSNNTYHLHRHMWNDVHEDWPFYTEQEKQMLKRRKPQNLTPPLSSDGGSSTSGQSPTSMHNGSPPPQQVNNNNNNNNNINNKRGILPNEGSGLEGPIAKKQRISHYKKETVNHENSRRGVTDSRDTSNMNPRSRENDELALPTYYASNVTPNAHESEDSGMSLSYSILTSDAAKRINAVPIPVVNDDDLVNGIKSENNKLTNGSMNYDFNQYTNITSIEQRRKYKTEFDNDYTEYRDLHAKIDETSKTFEKLGRRLRSEKHNDQKYKEIQKQILKEYDQKMKDRNHQEANKRFHYLHQKLSLIKRLVNDYDTTLKNKHIAQQSY